MKIWNPPYQHGAWLIAVGEAEYLCDECAAPDTERSPLTETDTVISCGKCNAPIVGPTIIIPEEAAKAIDVLEAAGEAQLLDVHYAERPGLIQETRRWRYLDFLVTCTTTTKVERESTA